MTNHVPRRLYGGVLQLTVLGVAVTAMFWAGIASMSAPPPRMTEASDQDVANWLTRVGLDAESLAAAEVTAEDVPEVVADARSHLTQGIEALRGADEAVGTAQEDVDRLTRLVQSGLANEQDYEDFGAAQTTLATARGSRQTLMNSFYSAAAESLSQSQGAVLLTLQSSRKQKWDLPVQYLAMTQSEADRVELRNALAHKRVAQKLGRPVAQSATTCINACNLNEAVVAASQGLANLETVTNAWNSNVFPE